MTIMKNIFINNYRRKKRYNTISDQTSNLYYLNSGEEDIFNKGEVKMFMEELFEIIDELPESLREPLYMYYERFKFHEIAVKIELSQGQVTCIYYITRQAQILTTK